MKDAFNEELKLNDTVIATCSNGGMPQKGIVTGFTRTMVRVDKLHGDKYWGYPSNRNPDRLIKYS
jgi:hypothetical protein